jgi:hypothetical protein
MRRFFLNRSPIGFWNFRLNNYPRAREDSKHVGGYDTERLDAKSCPPFKLRQMSFPLASVPAFGLGNGNGAPSGCNPISKDHRSHGSLSSVPFC